MRITLLEDTRRAVIDLHAAGIFTFGLTIDRQGQEYLLYLFGPGKYLVFSNVAGLPESLPRLYARLTGLGKSSARRCLTPRHARRGLTRRALRACRSAR